MIYSIINSPVGKLYITEENGFITNLGANLSNGYREGYTPLINDAIIQINEYFSGKRKYFNLPINPAGTDFQKKIWQEMNKIPYAKTIAYSQLMGNDYSRAVGRAVNKNPILIIQPCHRIIGKDGDLTGFSLGMDIKRYLLEHEKRYS